MAFGSAINGWGFTISKFALIYSKKFGIEYNKIILKLWGDNYYDAEAKKWKNYSEPVQKGVKKL